MKVQSVAVVGFVVSLASCGHSSSEKATVSGRAEPSEASMAAYDSLLSDLEAMRPFLVVKDDHMDCAAYTADASPVVAKLAAGTPKVNSARTSASADAVVQWQRAHALAMEKLLSDIVKPVRNGTCEAMEKDKTWTHVSFALAAVAQSPQPPAPVLERRALMDEMLAAADKATTADECKKQAQDVMAKHQNLEKAFAAMSPIERFVDDKIWEEDEESRAQADPRFKKLSELCGF